MSGIEERLVRDIEAVTGGVVVTDSDLQEARSAVIERIHVSQRRNRIRTIALAAAAAVVLVAGGVTTFLLLDDDAATRPLKPAPSVNDPDADFLTGASPTVQLVSGAWRLDNGGVMVNFAADGTVQFDRLGTLFSRPSTTGTYTIRGDTITVTVTQDQDPTCVGKAFSTRASLPAAGTLRFAAAQGAIEACNPMAYVHAQWEQVLPTRNKDMATLANSDSPDWHRLSGKDHLYGVFLAQGGGHLLEIDRGGAYYVVAGAGATVDRGQWSLQGRDLTLTSSAGSAKCSQGDKLVLRSVQEVNPGTNVIRGTVAQNTCGGAWTPSEWIMIPHEGG
jgi:hypothetical protein